MTARRPLLWAACAAALTASAAAQAIDGGWSPWQVDAEIDCCMYGGYERVKRYCTNPTPENTGALCADTAGDPSTQESVWRTCVCACNPKCDNVTAFCAWDTGKPAHCLCVHGKVRADNYDPNAVVTCVDPTTTAETAAAAESCSKLAADGSDTAGLIMAAAAAAWVVVWCVAVMIVMVSFGVKYGARVMHIVEEVMLCLAVILIAVGGDFVADSEVPCKLLSFAGQYFFQVAMVMFFLEALHAYSLVSFIVPKDGIVKAIINVVIAFGVPLFMCAVSFAVTFSSYGTGGCHCLCDFSTGQAWGYILPVAIWGFCTAITGEAAAGEKYKELHDTDPDQYIHANVCRKGVLIVMTFALFTYVLGLLAVHTALLVFYVAFLVAALCLGPAVFVWHTACDKNVSTSFHRKAKWLPWYKNYLFKPGAKPGDDDGAQTSRSEGGGFKDFYKWVTDGRQDVDAAKESEDVLFNKTKAAAQ